MDAPDNREAVLTWRGVRRGLPEIAPVAMYAFALGIAFGVAAQQAGLPGAQTVFMSAVVFSGAAQFVALDMGLDSAGLGALLLAVLAVNARHILMGAALQPWLGRLNPWRRYAVVGVLSDANWALSLRHHANGENDVGILVGGGIALWASWLLGTLAGLGARGSLANPERYGLDVLMLAFFATVLVSMWHGRADIVPWCAAAAASLLGLWLLPPNWHIMAGALVGGFVGTLQSRE